MLILNLWLDFQNFGIKTLRRAKEGDFMDAPMKFLGELSGYGPLTAKNAPETQMSKWDRYRSL